MQLSIIGSNALSCSPEQFEFAKNLGTHLAKNSHTIICGGLGGVMEAVCKGAKEENPSALTVGILPGKEKHAANRWVEVVIPSGLDIARNMLVVSSGDAVVAIGGGAGTLSEIAFAWQLGKPVLAVSPFEGWSKKLGGEALDEKRIDPIETAVTVEEVMQWLETLP